MQNTTSLLKIQLQLPKNTASLLTIQLQLPKNTASLLTIQLQLPKNTGSMWKVLSAFFKGKDVTLPSQHTAYRTPDSCERSFSNPFQHFVPSLTLTIYEVPCLACYGLQWKYITLNISLTLGFHLKIKNPPKKHSLLNSDVHFLIVHQALWLWPLWQSGSHWSEATSEPVFWWLTWHNVSWETVGRCSVMNEVEEVRTHSPLWKWVNKNSYSQPSQFYLQCSCHGCHIRDRPWNLLLYDYRYVGRTWYFVMACFDLEFSRGYIAESETRSMGSGYFRIFVLYWWSLGLKREQSTGKKIKNGKSVVLL